MPRAAKSPSQTPESQLAGLVLTRSNLEARQSAVAVEVEAALADRRKALIEGASDTDIADAERACREIEGTAFGIADALAEVGRRIAATEARIEAEREKARIETVAAGLERNAGEIEASAAALAKALAEVGRCRTNLAVTMSAAAAGLFDTHNGVPTPSQVAAEIVVQGFAHAVPGLEIHAELTPWSGLRWRRLVEGADPVASAAGFAEGIRATAAGIRAGEIDPALPEGHEPMPDFGPDRREHTVHVVSPFFYHRRDARVMVTTGARSLPVPIADLAVAHRLATIEAPPVRNLGSAALVETSCRWEDCTNLHFDLSEWEAENVEAKRDAFHAEGGLKAA